MMMSIMIMILMIIMVSALYINKPWIVPQGGGDEEEGGPEVV